MASPALPPSAPSFGSPLSRLFGRAMLRMVGMKVGGTLPDVSKVILIGTPHTSNWDLILAMGMKYALGLDYKWMMKKEAFIFPFGGMFKAMGGIPIDRKAAKNIVEQMTDWFEANETAWIGITPSGTRSKVGAYKKGYLRIAYATGIPVFLVGVDKVTGTLKFDQFMELTGEIDVDNAQIRDFVRTHYTGLKPKNN